MTQVLAQVLIVEDVDSMLELVREVVAGAEGFAVSGAVANAWNARIELTRRRPDVVLLDEILPGESSLDLLDLLVSEGIPVVLMTGMDEANHELPAGAFSRVMKPGWKTLEQDRARIAAELRRAMGQVAGP